MCKNLLDLANHYEKYPNTMPPTLNLYFDNRVARCVESAFAAYVMMLCYNFADRGVTEKAKGSLFH
jgi:hypothetical protein